MYRLIVRFLCRASAPRLALAAVLALALAGLTLASPPSSRADAGPFPTHTRTVTPIPILRPTLYPTVAVSTAIVLTIFPSPTAIPLQALQPTARVESLSVDAKAAEAAPSPAVACWPIAIILALAIIIGASYMLSRGKEG